MAKSIRLNNTIRGTILDNVMTAWKSNNPAPEYPAENASWEGVANVIRSIYLKEAAPYTLLIAEGKIPSKMVKQCSYIRARIRACGVNEDVFVGFGTDDKGMSITVPQTNPKSSYVYSWDDDNIPALIKAALGAREAELETIREKRKIHREWMARRDQKSAQIASVLVGVNTSAQLIDVWPEVEKYMPVGVVDPSNISLPAISVDALNEGL